MRLIPAEHSDESALVSEIIDKTCHISQNYALNNFMICFYKQGNYLPKSLILLTDFFHPLLDQHEMPISAKSLTVRCRTSLG